MLVVCPNPTMDRQVFVTEVHPGSVSRAVDSRTLAGGKPIDVLRAMAAHQFIPELLVVLPESHQDYRDRLADEGIAAHYFDVPGTLRDTIIVYEDSGRSTVINGRGADLPRDHWLALVDHVVARAADVDWVVISGSFPPGVDGSDVGDLLDQVHRAGAKIALDTGATWLVEAMAARPDLVTPNLAEAQQAISGRPAVEAVEFTATAPGEALTAARTLVERGTEFAIVTVGSAGSAWATADSQGLIPALEVTTVNPIGAGDAFLGGLMASLAHGAPFADAVAWGSATAASAVGQWIPGKADRQETIRFRGLLP